MLSKPIHLSETEESGISCVGVKSVDLRRNAKSEGSSLGPYRRWGVMSTHASILVDSVGPPRAEVCRTAASFP